MQNGSILVDDCLLEHIMAITVEMMMACVCISGARTMYGLCVQTTRTDQGCPAVNAKVSTCI
jgi:hypothetical protein